MDVEFDPDKDVGNVEKHGISLARAADLEILRFVENSRVRDRERRLGFMAVSMESPIARW